MQTIKNFCKKHFPKTVKLLKISYKYLKPYISAIFGIPIVDIVPTQLTNICNAKCVFCPHQYNNTDKKGVMSFDLYKNIIQNYIKSNVKRIHLVGMGEVYVDGNIIEKIEYARKNGLEVYITTNGTLFYKNDFYKRTLDLNPTFLYISTPGFSAKAYKEIFNIPNYDEVLTGIRRLLEYKKNNNVSTRICFGFRGDKPLQELLNDPDYITHIKPYVDDGILEELYHRDEFDTWAGEVPEENFKGAMKILTKTSTKFCHKLVSQFSVLLDGTVKICGCIYHKTEYDDMIIGSLQTQTLKDILRSRKLKRILWQWLLFKRLPYNCTTCTRPEDRR